jgi:putative chitinase
MTPITPEFIQRATGASSANAILFLPHLDETCRANSINTPRRLAGFLSQIGHESGGLSRLEESLNYSTDALLAKFSRTRISAEDANAFGRRRGQPADQNKLANILYGGAFGRANLGNTHPGDGAKFIGRGLKQLTGRGNHTRCGDALGLDLVANPKLLLLPVNAARSAGWFWAVNGLNQLADLGDVLGMTRRVNGGTFGLSERNALWDEGLKVLA